MFKDDRMISFLTAIVVMVAIGTVIQRSEVFSSNSEGLLIVELIKNISAESLFIASISIAVTIVSAYLGYKFLGSRLSVESAVERLQDDDAEKLLHLRRKIEIEKNAEAALLLKEEAEKYEKRINATKRVSLWSEDGSLRLTWQKTLAVTRERLVDESSRLNARSRANLRSGIAANLLGGVVILLTLFVYAPSYKEDTWASVFSGYAPRLVLIALIQFMAVFFFRMYVSNESDIKQNKNEITNIEQKIAAALMLSDKDLDMTRLAESIAMDERNFILKKGERSVSESSHDLARSISETIIDVSKKEG